jgi:ABC-type Fe3+-citrate transport system substrate-binding protein
MQREYELYKFQPEINYVMWHIIYLTEVPCLDVLSPIEVRRDVEKSSSVNRIFSRIWPFSEINSKSNPKWKLIANLNPSLWATTAALERMDHVLALLFVAPTISTASYYCL